MHTHTHTPFVQKPIYHFITNSTCDLVLSFCVCVFVRWFYHLFLFVLCCLFCFLIASAFDFSGCAAPFRIYCWRMSLLCSRTRVAKKPVQPIFRLLSLLLTAVSHLLTFLALPHFLAFVLLLLPLLPRSLHCTPFYVQMSWVKMYGVSVYFIFVCCMASFKPISHVMISRFCFKNT